MIYFNTQEICFYIIFLEKAFIEGYMLSVFEWIITFNPFNNSVLLLLMVIISILHMRELRPRELK